MTVEASLRKDDGRVVVKTTRYVSHRANRGTPWTSQFSLDLEDAAKLRDELNGLLVGYDKYGKGPTCPGSS